MEEISAFAAKTHLSRLLKRVQHGEKFTITKHGVPVAVISPLDQGKSRDIPALIEELHKLRKKTKKGEESLKALIEEGKRFCVGLFSVSGPGASRMKAVTRHWMSSTALNRIPPSCLRFGVTKWPMSS